MEKQKTKKINYFKIILAILSIIELILIITTKKEILQNINIWRLYIVLYMFVIFNIMYIFTKQKRVIKKGVKK